MVERSLSMREDSLLLDFPRSFQVKKELILEGRLQLSTMQFRVNCLGQWNMDASASVTADYMTELDVENQEPSVSTLLVNIDSKFDPYGAMSTPLYQTATFKQLFVFLPHRLLAKLEKADRAFCFSSGMAAFSAVANLVGSGQEIVAGDDIYGGSDRLLSRVTPKSGVLVKRVNTSDLDEVAAVIGPKTKLVCFVGPQLQMDTFNLTFFRNAFCLRISEIAHANGALVLVDNSIMSPVLSRWLELGADIVMRSATKFIAGHSDVMAGVLAVKEERF
ncbi:hypothetical protein V6N11_055397 [Hibiscus sabdariffa]|uniref:cysteine-S-conjugate beta-lyase n=1 Tax=Hibiscus sabdariffa TaxID=183260 RepID=A0ABR2PF74_9ROSI